MRLINADKYCEFLNTYPLKKAQDNFMTFYRDALQYTSECEVEAIPIEWLENFSNNYCDLAAAIDTQFFINEFILKRWGAESEGKNWSQIKNNEEKNYQYIKKLLREGKTLEAAKFVEEKENEMR